MGWASHYIEKLSQGQTIRFRPRGRSMTGLVNDGQLVTVEPMKDKPAEKNEVVLCRVGGTEYLHLVIATQPGLVLIGNNHGGINGWTAADKVFGRLVAVES